MSSYASVQAFSDKCKTGLPRLDVLIANAGVNPSNFRIAEDNEEAVTVNIVSLFLLGFLLYPKLRETAAHHKTQTYFTTTASDLHEIAKFEERKSPPGHIFAALNKKSNFNKIERYATSKLIEILIVRQMAALSPLDSRNVIINCVSPGYVGLSQVCVSNHYTNSLIQYSRMCHSELAREFDTTINRLAAKVLARTTEVGSRTIVYGASAKGESHGQYIPDCKITVPRGIWKGEEAAETQSRVWEELKEKLESIRPGITALS